MGKATSASPFLFYNAKSYVRECRMQTVQIVKVSIMYLDVKVTTWQRVQIDSDATEQKVIDIIKEGTHFDLWDNELATDYENLVSTEQEVKVEENDGFSTMELYNEEGEMIWENGKGNLNGVDDEN